MATIGRDGGSCLGLLLLFALTSAAVGEVMLVREDGEDQASWGYSHLPATFPLTWTQARAACEAVPGSMLARVDGWQQEAAVEEYLKEVHFKQAVWLANRQTLPEVLEDEQREMNHVGGSAGVLGEDVTMGGDVGVTLRCAVFRVGVGIVHELCDEAAVSAALCVQRLSNKRPLLEECPTSPHRQWVLVTRLTETSASSPPQQQTTVTVVGLQQCHHHHRRYLARAICRPQGGWERPACSPESSSPKHHQGTKKPRRGHHQHDRGGSSRRPPPSHPATDVDHLDYERGLKEKEYFSSAQQDKARSKRSAEPESTSELHTTDKASPDVHSSKATTTTTTTDTTTKTTTHQPASEGHMPDINDKVLLFITDYKRSNKSNKGKSHDETQPQNITSSPQTLPEKVEPHLDDKDSKKTEITTDETINEIETETASTVVTGEPSAKHHSIKKSLKEDGSVAHLENHGHESMMHHVVAHVKGSKEPNEEQEKTSSNGGEAAATANETPILQVGTGPIFVFGPEDDNETHSENPTHNSPKRPRALVFPKDFTQSNPNGSIRPHNTKEPSTTPTEPSSAGTNTSAEGEEAPSHASTTTPSRPVVFPETINVNPPLTPVTEKRTDTAVQPTGEPTPSETKTENAPDTQNSEPESSVAVTTPEVSVPKTEEAGDENRKTEGGEKEGKDEGKAEGAEKKGQDEGKTGGEEREKPTTSNVAKKPEAGHTEEPSTTAKPHRPREAEESENSDSTTKTAGAGATNDPQEGSEKPDTKAPRSEVLTESPAPLPTTESQDQDQDHNSTGTSPTERPKGHGTQHLIAEIFKSIFG
ncbi:cell surface glycoprotein 1-like [Eriocheir sinensis]|uniref:cell surface glycoprotein 1-like n=1 Tax=Eriocheir sinensis TaxID=95602 RepID=UPI0021C79FE4|nr:cell surface glycoprotein 1-like [Eriocheir sinensis]